jgi:hypothetical protein
LLPSLASVILVAGVGQSAQAFRTAAVASALAALSTGVALVLYGPLERMVWGHLPGVARVGCCGWGVAAGLAWVGGWGVVLWAVLISPRGREIQQINTLGLNFSAKA